MVKLPTYEPMLATSWAEPFSDPEWGYEVKWDGVRTLLYNDGTQVQLRSRRGIDVTGTYPELCETDGIGPAILDGEVIALDPTGRPSFGQLQKRMNLSSPNLVADARAATPVSYMAFDILHFGGKPTLSMTWNERRELLASLDLHPPLLVSEAIAENPTDLWQFVVDRNLEGIVAKRLDSRYKPGMRSPDWRKITTSRTVRAVVGGFTQGDGGRAHTFGALLLGLWTDEGLRWIGAVGTGFSDPDLSKIRSALDDMRLDRSPFIPSGEMPRNVAWVFPQLVAMVEYKEWTSVGRLRAPVFKGFTDDPPGSIDWETEGPSSA